MSVWILISKRFHSIFFKKTHHSILCYQLVEAGEECLLISITCMLLNLQWIRIGLGLNVELNILVTRSLYQLEQLLQSMMYARTFFEEYNVDSLTVAPYMGEDSIKPFLEYDGKWVVLLALTSNNGSHDFQLMEDAQGERLFEKVLRTSQQWGNTENMMYVVGATQGKMFECIRRVAPDHFLLVPGVGAQGGSLQEVCRYGMNKDCGLLVNSSRGIIYASQTEDFAEAAAIAAQKLQQEMEVELAKL